LIASLAWMGRRWTLLLLLFPPVLGELWRVLRAPDFSRPTKTGPRPEKKKKKRKLK